jgi:transposase
MDREALLGLEKAALVELVVRLHARVAELEAAVARLGGPPKSPGNSSVPPAQGFKANRAERRAKRRRRGQLGLSRRRQEPDLVVKCRPTSCRGCGAALAGRVSLWLILHREFAAKLHRSFTAKVHHGFTAKVHQG